MHWNAPFYLVLFAALAFAWRCSRAQRLRRGEAPKLCARETWFARSGRSA